MVTARTETSYKKTTNSVQCREEIINIHSVNLLINKNVNNNNENYTGVCLDSSLNAGNLSELTDNINEYYDQVEVLLSEIGILRNVDANG